MAVELCQLCEARKPKRACPAVRGNICSQCCGQEREETVDCPLDCEFLVEARRHEKGVQVSEKDLPNADIQVSEEFLREREELLVVMGTALTRAAREVSAIDADLRECLEASIRTHRTLGTGLYYETRPASAYAATIQQRLMQQISEYRDFRLQQTGVNTLRDADILGLLVFFQRAGLHLNNGRRRGRLFVDFLRERFPADVAGAEEAQGGPILT